MALTKATLVKDVYGQPWRFASVDLMRAFDYSTYTGDKVYLESYHLGIGLGSGLFLVSKGTTEVEDGGSVIVANDGTRLLRIFDGEIFADMWALCPAPLTIVFQLSRQHMHMPLLSYSNCMWVAVLIRSQVIKSGYQPNTGRYICY